MIVWLWENLVFLYIILPFFLKNTQFKEIFNHEGVGVVYSKVRFRSLKLIEFVEK